MSVITAPALPARPPATPAAVPLQPAQAPAAESRMPAATEWLRRFTVDEYQRLITQGLLGPDEQCELLEGLIVRQMARDPIRDASVSRVRRLLDARVPAGWHVRVQSAVTTGDSQPEPDAAVVKGDDFDYGTRHPSAADTTLVVEVGNTSAADDRRWKGLIYARAGFSVFWVLNLTDRRVEVYSEPTGPDPAPGYRRRDDYGPGQQIPVSIGGIAAAPVSVDELFMPQSVRP